MGSTEVGYLFRRPVFQSVVSSHDFEDPGIHWKGFQFVVSKKENAVGHFFSHSWQLAKGFFCFLVGLRSQSVQINLFFLELDSRFVNVRSAESEFTFSQS